MIIRDLVTRMSFRTDTSALRTLDTTLNTVKKSIVAIAGTALSGFMIKAGLDAENLYLQFDRMTKQGMDPLIKARDELSGKGSVFSKREVTEGALALAQLGFKGKEAALRLEQAVLLSARANKSVGQIAIDLGNALQKGGLSEYLLSLRLITLEQADNFKLLENKIAQSSGDIAERVTREYRKQYAEVLERNREVLEEDQKALVKRTGGVRRTLVQLKNLWESISRLIMTSLLPVLDDVADIIEDIVEITERWRREIKEAGGVWNLLFKKLREWFPEYSESINKAKGALERFGTAVKETFRDKLDWAITIGGFMLFLITKNPMYLGLVWGKIMLDIILEGEWKAILHKLSHKLTKNMIIALTIGGFIMFLLTKNITWIITGSLTSGALAEVFEKEWDALLKVMRKKLTPGMITAIGAGATIGGLMMALLTKNPTWLGIARGSLFGAAAAGTAHQLMEGMGIDPLLGTAKGRVAPGVMEMPGISSQLFWMDFFSRGTSPASKGGGALRTTGEGPNIIIHMHGVGDADNIVKKLVPVLRKTMRDLKSQKN